MRCSLDCQANIASPASPLVLSPSIKKKSTPHQPTISHRRWFARARLVFFPPAATLLLAPGWFSETDTRLHPDGTPALERRFAFHPFFSLEIATAREAAEAAAAVARKKGFGKDADEDAAVSEDADEDAGVGEDAAMDAGVGEDADEDATAKKAAAKKAAAVGKNTLASWAVWTMPAAATDGPPDDAAEGSSDAPGGTQDGQAAASGPRKRKGSQQNANPKRKRKPGTGQGKRKSSQQERKSSSNKRRKRTDSPPPEEVGNWSIPAPLVAMEAAVSPASNGPQFLLSSLTSPADGASNWWARPGGATPVASVGQQTPGNMRRALNYQPAGQPVDGTSWPAAPARLVTAGRLVI